MEVIAIIQRVRNLLQDNTPVPRWTNSDLLDAYNEALLAVVQNRPDVNSQLLAYTCQAQAVQSLPPGTYRLLDIVDNPASGRTVIATTRSSLDSLLPNWTTATAADVEQYVYDQKSPSVFYVYPVPPANHTLNLLVSQAPARIVITDFDTDTQVFSLDDLWLNPVINYMLFRAFSMDMETEATMQQAQSYLAMFANDLGLKWNVDQMFRQMLQGKVDG
ncbi:DUF6682 family protein [Endozoicomonas sp. GU-1]|uniref:phage adaptor protein n=1 Tax=Endozoicomonas sp. GU-1 TaxID=3009078 RepID=UPI0022B50911|nr:DUF6682 family protein [Endozoicomonas sp. GU-1]WBA81551.1 hypothetical protein O2T12_25325 [Endozoicomonas sp. GU-1]WBA84504.1 hypothetical protein O3276_14505 [Endozoicomonas sp. GU-1]